MTKNVKYARTGLTVSSAFQKLLGLMVSLEVTVNVRRYTLLMKTYVLSAILLAKNAPAIANSTALFAQLATSNNQTRISVHPSVLQASFHPTKIASENRARYFARSSTVSL